MVDAVEPLTFAAGTVIVVEGDAANGMYIIQQGQCVVSQAIEAQAGDVAEPYSPSTLRAGDSVWGDAVGAPPNSKLCRILQAGQEPLPLHDRHARQSHYRHTTVTRPLHCRHTAVTLPLYTSVTCRFVQGGDYFGERALLGDGRRTATVTAASEVSCFFIDQVA